MGFRGSVGLSYTGGYRNDGFLRAENYDKVEQTSIPNAQNIDEIKPERIHNIELSLAYSPGEQLSFEWIAFSNIVQNVIDVGVIYEDPANYQMVPIGNDIPGDWNGYWYFKNTPGSFSQIGSEWIVKFKTEKWQIDASHALVKVLNATDEQKQLAENSASMYLATDSQGKLHHKAYPENVSRLTVQWAPLEKLRLQLTNLYYFTWYSPIGTSAEGSLISNLGIHFTANNHFSFYAIAKNLLNQTPLYPMNSNAGGPDVSPGTPGRESTSFWGGTQGILTLTRYLITVNGKASEEALPFYYSKSGGGNSAKIK